MLQTVCWLMSRRHAVVFARQNMIDLVKCVLNSLVVGCKQVAIVVKRKAANIAVELPEAVKDQTHYRTLFLCALTFFVMTFFVNTLAELVRLRFRKRAVQL